jgi:hypothetical protein
MLPHAPETNTYKGKEGAVKEFGAPAHALSWESTSFFHLRMCSQPINKRRDKFRPIPTIPVSSLRSGFDPVLQWLRGWQVALAKHKSFKKVKPGIASRAP